MTNRSKAILSILAASVIGGGVTTASKIGIAKLPPFTFTFLRFLIATICVLPFFIRAKVKMDKRLFALTTLAALATSNVFFFTLGIQQTTASIGQLLYSAVPILTIVILLFFHKVKIRASRIFFIFLGFIGVLFIILLPIIHSESLYSGSIPGNFLICIGVILWTLYMIYSKKYHERYSPFIITSIYIFLSTVVFFLLSISELYTHHGWWGRVDTSSLYPLLYISLFGTITTVMLYQYSIKYGGALITSLSFYLVPIFAYISAYIFLGEKLTVYLIIGTLIIFVSIAATIYSS